MNSRFLNGLAAMVAAWLLVFSSTVQADTIGVSLVQLAGSKSEFAGPHGGGTNSFAYDWDSASPYETAGSAPAGYGPNSFGANVDKNGATAADRYRTLRVSLDAFAGGAITLGELSGFSYFNEQISGDDAWRVSIYTEATGTGDAASWYKSRLQYTPTESTAGGWQQKTVNSSLWSAKSSERIMMIDFTLGANSGGFTTAANLDGITFNSTRFNGGSVSLDLAPAVVPLPAALPAGLALFGAVALKRKMGRPQKAK